MEKLQDLRALLIHEVMDVYSAEEQILEALPKMIEYATNTKLKKSLQDHLKVTRTQKQRLDKVQQLLKVGEDQKGTGKKGGLFGLMSTGQKCKGMQGIIAEGNSIMKEDIDPEVLDATIIASCQKVEHYEICSYGTLKAYAEELGLTQVVKLLDETLEEEYEADFLLTELAVFGGVNEEADTETGESKRAGTSKTAADSRNSSLSERRASSPTAGSSRTSSGKSPAARKGTASAGGSASSKSSSSSSAKKKTASSKK
jgi:ferritin-like metal-binding protein YciE